MSKSGKMPPVNDAAGMKRRHAMRREDVPPGQHVAIPARDNDELHEGPYASSCFRCAEIAADLSVQHAPVVGGIPVGFGSVVRLKPESRPTGHSGWVTITAIRLNAHTGAVWMHAFALGENVILQAHDIEEVRP